MKLGNSGVSVAVLTFTLSGVLLAPGPSQADAFPYPDSISHQSSQFLAAKARARLKAAYGEYQSKTFSRDQWNKALTELGWSEADRKAMETHFGQSFEKAHLAAKWEDDEIVIEAAGNRIEVGVAEYLRGTLRINGAAYRWDAKKSASDNLAAYKSLFHSPGEDKESLSNWLVPSAYAETDNPSGVLSLQVSGLRLELVVGYDGSRAQMLRGYKEKVVKETEQCKTDSAEDYKKHLDDLGVAKMLRFNDWVNTGESAFFKNCVDIQAFAEQEALEMKLRHPIPPDELHSICTKVNDWAKCVREKLPATAETFKRKNLKDDGPKESNEWRDTPPETSPAK